MKEGNMNIDERLEALTHTVELLATMHKDTEKRMERLESLVTDMAEGTARLLHVAEIHEQRLSRLEGN
jgi:hypothetical protein